MFLVAFVVAAAAQTSGGVTAVLELRNKLDGPERNVVDAGFLTDVVRQQMLEEVPSLKLMTRENVITLLEATGRKLDECEGECEIDTGRRLGADFVVTGEILRFGRGLRVNLRLHDTRSARLLSAAVASGDGPEALEKDLVRAVGKLVGPLKPGNAPPVAKSPEWFETVGFYLTAGVGSLGAENGTPRAMAAPINSLTLSRLKSEAVAVGFGVQYHPVPWLFVDAAYLFTALSGQVDSVSGDGRTDSPKALDSSALSLGVNGALRLTGWFRAFGGVGAQYFLAKIAPSNPQLDGTNRVHFASAPSSGQYTSNASVLRPFARVGVEWRPQERFGLQLFGVVYPVSHEIDVYVNDVNLATQDPVPVLKYKLPTVTANAAIALYF